MLLFWWFILFLGGRSGVAGQPHGEARDHVAQDREDSAPLGQDQQTRSQNHRGSPDGGDIIDCVPRHRQPALDHPLLKDHKIQRAAERPKKAAAAAAAGRNVSKSASRRAWHHAGHCPRGTVPIRRSSVDDVLRAKSLFHFGKKTLLRPPARSSDAPDVVSGNGHEHAIAYTINGGEFYGAKATINVWDPSVQVSPELYGDSRPRLFTYWTTNRRIAIGAAISPVSSFEGGQYDITVLIWKDPKLGNWWMSFGDGGALVGYWPAELFSHLSEHATMVEWGGEVVDTRPDGSHTATQMGSGHFAAGGFSRAGYFRNLEVVDADNTLASVGSGVSTLAENTDCYDIRSFAGDSAGDADGWGAYFYFGGPGNNPRCP
ncbi:hypothetical protein ZIOFF_037988 [Zingiber officinale]|uniref:Neprosin PEP catalytic domain-containing protein n=1 Tax=Zingiber officinale TaxID=94328 RepID=A0A8J5GC94_ZINOF|nr:hypothetical protein ZIOFF_037988 [Zingiber officinale]